MGARMAITKEEVAHVARLARLKLEEAEIEQLTKDLGHILAHVDQLKELDTSHVEPTRHVAVEQMPLRADVPRPSLTHEQALSGGPRILRGGFAVPVFVDD